MYLYVPGEVSWFSPSPDSKNFQQFLSTLNIQTYCQQISRPYTCFESCKTNLVNDTFFLTSKESNFLSTFSSSLSCRIKRLRRNSIAFQTTSKTRKTNKIKTKSRTIRAQKMFSIFLASVVLIFNTDTIAGATSSKHFETLTKYAEVEKIAIQYAGWKDTFKGKRKYFHFFHRISHFQTSTNNTIRVTLC